MVKIRHTDRLEFNRSMKSAIQIECRRESERSGFRQRAKAKGVSKIEQPLPAWPDEGSAKLPSAAELRQAAWQEWFRRLCERRDMSKSAHGVVVHSKVAKAV